MLLGLWALPHTHPEYRPAHSQQKRIAVAQQLCLTLVEHVSAFKIMRGTCEKLFLQDLQWETTNLMDISMHNHIYCLFFEIRCCPHDVHALLGYQPEEGSSKGFCSPIPKNSGDWTWWQSTDVHCSRWHFPFTRPCTRCTGHTSCSHGRRTFLGISSGIATYGPKMVVIKSLPSESRTRVTRN